MGSLQLRDARRPAENLHWLGRFSAGRRGSGSEEEADTAHDLGGFAGEAGAGDADELDPGEPDCCKATSLMGEAGVADGVDPTMKALQPPGVSAIVFWDAYRPKGQ